jgi:septum formation protein
MLGLLSGGTHRVLTAVAVISRDGREGMLSITDVSFRDIGQEEMARYWQSGEPKDKAGAYAIQGLGGLFVKHIQGSYSGVVGLPLFETAGLLDRFGIACWQPFEPCPSDQQ